MKSLCVCGLRSLQPGCMGIKPISRFFVVCAKVFTSSGEGYISFQGILDVRGLR